MIVWLPKTAFIQPRASSPRFADASKRYPPPGHKSGCQTTDRDRRDRRSTQALKIWRKLSNLDPLITAKNLPYGITWDNCVPRHRVSEVRAGLDLHCMLKIHLKILVKTTRAWELAYDTTGPKSDPLSQVAFYCLPPRWIKLLA